MGTGQSPKRKSGQRASQAATGPGGDGVRERFGWKVILSDPEGATSEVEIWNYWSPDYDGIEDEIQKAAAATATAAARELRIGVGCTRIAA